MSGSMLHAASRYQAEIGGRRNVTAEQGVTQETQETQDTHRSNSFRVGGRVLCVLCLLPSTDR